MDTPEKEITIYDIARHLNISAATVSRALMDHPSVNVNTKQKVQETAQQMGYRSNHLASNLRKKRSNIIGLVVGNLDSSFMTNIIVGIEKVLSEANYNLIISQSLDNIGKEIKIARAMYNNRVDGLLVSLAYDTENAEHFESFVKRGIPLVYFDRIFPDNNCPGVEIDNVKAAYEITEHLIQQGCKRIVHVTAYRLSSVALDRFNGYKQALLDYNIPFDESLVIYTHLGIEDGVQAAQTILAMPNRPDGVFAINDASAVGCIKELKKAGVKIPDDIAFAGFNNDSIASIVEPGLTTVNYKGYEMGEMAAQILVDKLNNNYTPPAGNKLILKSELVVRESSQKKKRK
ncbi:LacI family DNA-binding transcriptional regulator [Mucilaginibacter sp. Bleaf8]|uniref:LacI family DNA-binding transcriptional regulator n=1 Tax=Mucilaginibacter sp. Bleaf8 TaxID=2834430 RepID=UPI001BCF0C7F|nr:LacI family DNA-binding transcriptional regulator [Mucilaginibacter sp. Bleaf8]MBS7563666.1 LacI family DNA-binding transcriptional regulator [Mucilaginibacter sp. Bleaf8]